MGEVNVCNVYTMHTQTFIYVRTSGQTMTLKNSKKLSVAMAAVFMVAVFTAVVLLVPPGLTNAQMMPGDMPQNETTKTPYVLADIEHAFGIMEEYVTYDENKTMTFDLTAAVRNPDISLQDIRIALDFADHSNEIMDAAIGPMGQVNELQQTRDERISQAIDELENGKFSKLFGESGPTGNINDASYTSVAPPIIQAFGGGGHGGSIHETRHSGGSSTLACGGSFSQPHPAATHTITGNFATQGSAVINLIVNGYHQVPWFASYNYPNDYAKVIDAYNCNNGPFRTQSIVGHTGSYYYHSNHDVEPNPEVLTYVWPSLWWGSYVHWWHDNF